MQDATFITTKHLPPVIPDSWASLPEHILVQILQHVPVQDRFRYCALVSPDWATAAVASTTDVCMPSRCHDLLNLQSWLVQYGGQLTAVSLTGQVDQEVVILPCAKLRRLDLEEVTVQVSDCVCVWGGGDRGALGFSTVFGGGGRWGSQLGGGARGFTKVGVWGGGGGAGVGGPGGGGGAGG